jgi:hypothetical protein
MKTSGGGRMSPITEQLGRKKNRNEGIGVTTTDGGASGERRGENNQIPKERG